MNNNVNPAFLPGFGPNQGFPGFEFVQDIRRLENRVTNLEHEVNRLRNRVSRLENRSVTPQNSEGNYTSNYQVEGYNMM